ncbi:hypothetical protein ACFOTA_14430 [Chitinophaga sp. GCM10012297]|uniref:6-phosphogluconate dehydrogenase n=1 Tax=Chitinophaga chungangae TaxID=2821488 RepID=A0ABS3YH59_9BACT|nr:hypothetical protein [Chitinophaga chungangae]MBO9153414.1 hypothetical protein [Chitinophaga chungangae]
MKRFLFVLVAVLLLIFGIFFVIRYYFVFGRGTKAGELNFFVQKGYVWKTYEGRLIQTGFKPQNLGGVQSNEFQFSVTSEKVAAQLMAASGKVLELHYKEYLGALPWRGYSNFIVDSVLSVTDPATGKKVPL